MPRLPFSRSLGLSSATSLALCLLTVGCGDDAAGTTAGGGTTGGEDETGRDETTTRTDTTTSISDTEDVDTTQGVDSTGEACDCDEGQVCDPETNTCVGCLDADDCDGDAPHCNETEKVCVECLDESHCDDQLCHPDSGSCVDCVENDDCEGEDAPVCNPDGGTCVGCVADEDCGEETPVCDPEEHACVGCLDDTDCGEETPICDLENTTCVGCLEDRDCDEAAPVCDLDITTCVECLEDTHCDDPTPACHDEGQICVECTTDDHCGLGYCCDVGANTCSACLPDTVSLMVPDSTSNHLVLFDPTDGSLKEAEYFELAAGTPFQAVQIEDEIWVTEQIGDRISRWSLTGDPLGAIGGGNDGGLDNVRGLVRIGEHVYVANEGSENNAPGSAIVVFELNGDKVEDIDISGHVSSAFSILSHGADILVSSSNSGQDVQRFELDGTSLGSFYNDDMLAFAHQLSHALTGDVLVAGFTSNNVLLIDGDSGGLIAGFAAADARGVYQLANGGIFWTSAAGAFVYNPLTEESTEVYQGTLRHVSLLQLP